MNPPTESTGDARPNAPNPSAEDRFFMACALALARQAEALGEVPVGAVLVRDGAIVGEGFNQPIGRRDATAHAEILALRAGGQLVGNYRLPNTCLFVTLEPCLMCVGAMPHARIARLVYGATDPKVGAAGSLLNAFSNSGLNHQVQVQGGVLATECSTLLRDFFRTRR